MNKYGIAVLIVAGCFTGAVNAAEEKKSRAESYQPYVAHDKAVETMKSQNMTGGGTQTFKQGKTGEISKPSSPAAVSGQTMKSGSAQ